MILEKKLHIQVDLNEAFKFKVCIQSLAINPKNGTQIKTQKTPSVLWELTKEFYEGKF